MNLAYYRTSTRNHDETVATLKQSARNAGFSVLGEAVLPAGQATIFTICRPDWAQQVIGADPNLLGLLPCSVVVMEQGGKVVVGASTPALLGSAAPSVEIRELAELADDALRVLVEQAAGVQPRKPTHLKLYSTHSCPYCRMEKSWLDQKKAPYEQIMVDQDQKAAEELVQRTGQMGVPVTEVLYDSGESDFVIGFDRQKLERVLKAM